MRRTASCCAPSVGWTATVGRTATAPGRRGEEIGVSVAHRRFPPDAAITHTVRAFVAECLGVLGLTRQLDDAELVVTELVTNVVIHARTQFEIKIVALADGV